jgi:long-chain acyl-CoA synthetase
MDKAQNIRDMVHFIGQRFPDKIALQIKEETGYRSYSFAQLEGSVVRLANGLKKLGLKKGDRCALISENRPEWGLAYLAVIYAGGIIVPLDPLLKPSEISRLLDDSETRFLFLSGKFDETGRELLRNIATLKGLINFDATQRQDDIYAFNQLIEQAENERSDEDVDPDDTVAIVYTSGTTGTPKGVMLTHTNLIFDVYAMAKTIKVDHDDRTVSVLPLHHTFESTCDLMLVLFVSGTITYVTSMKSTRIFEALQETRATIFIAVPLLFQLIYEGIFSEIANSSLFMRLLFKLFWDLTGIFPSLALKKAVFKKLHKKFGGQIRFFVSGGAAIDRQILEGFRHFGIEVIQGYGLTEAAPVVAANRLEDNCLGSVGRPLPGVEVEIKDPDAQGVGELLSRGPNTMKGYYRRPDLTNEVIKDGWLYTGDLACRDSAGRIFISGRSKDVIVSPSGQNIYPDEIEMVLLRQPAVKEICVFGAQVASGIRKGSEIVSAVIFPDEKTLGPLEEARREKVNRKVKEIVADYNRSCTSYKRIENFKISWEELPKTSTRKVKRNHVKKLWEVLP